MELAPIVLFAYNRPEHLLNTLNSLCANQLAEKSSLTIFCDGIKIDAPLADIQNVKKTREVAASKKWCAEVKLIFSEKNNGLPVALPKLVSEILQKHDRIIVLEDDLQLSPGFLKYMNEALELYSADEQVMHVSGYMYPVKNKMPKSFFLDLASVWGWGTWKRAWKHFNNNAAELFDAFDKNKKNKFNLDGALDFYSTLKSCAKGPKQFWDIKWYTSVFNRGGLCLHPGKSQVINKGHDGSGINCGEDAIFQQQEIAGKIHLEKVPLKIDEKNVAAVSKFFGSKSTSASKAMVKKLVPSIASNLLTKNAALKKTQKQAVKSMIKSMVPPVFHKKQTAQTAKNLWDFEERMNWSLYADVLNAWGEKNVWNELLLLLNDKQGKILDFGFGTGRTAHLIQNKIQSLEVFGLEAHEELVNFAIQSGLEKSNFLRGEISGLEKFGENFFDYTFSVSVLQYFFIGEVDYFAEQISRATKKISYHMLPVTKWNRNEEVIFSGHYYRNNTADWWASKFAPWFKNIKAIPSSWEDSEFNRSNGIWLICEK